jgi:hypothetical protein
LTKKVIGVAYSLSSAGKSFRDRDWNGSGK